MRNATNSMIKSNDVFYLLFFFLPFEIESFPYQFLPMREGYVPVYIRMGDTPLNDINPELAIAFHEIGANGRQLKSNNEVSGTKTVFSLAIEFNSLRFFFFSPFIV